MTDKHKDLAARVGAVPDDPDDMPVAERFQWIETAARAFMAEATDQEIRNRFEFLAVCARAGYETQ